MDKIIPIMKMKFFLLVLFLCGCMPSKADIIRINSDWKRSEAFNCYAVDSWSLENGEILPCDSGEVAISYNAKDNSCSISISFLNANNKEKKKYTYTLKGVYVKYNEDYGGWFIFECETNEEILSYITSEDPNYNILLLSPKIRIN